MNFYDSEKMSDLLMNHGYATTNTQEDADLIIVNTCHIREKASEKLFSDLGRIKKIKDKKRLTVAVTGCVAQAEGEQISARAPYVDLITGPQSYHRLPEMLRKIANGKSISPLLEFMPNEKFDNLEYGKNKKGPTSFVSIQEGCDKFCTFCVVPYTRGAEFSRSISEIIDEVNNLTDHGVIEVTLLGQNVNSWHGVDYKGKERGLAFLINEISNIKKNMYKLTNHPPLRQGLHFSLILMDCHRIVIDLSLTFHRFSIVPGPVSEAVWGHLGHPMATFGDAWAHRWPPRDTKKRMRDRTRCPTRSRMRQRPFPEWPFVMKT